jgi:hypothetical protein
MPRSPNAELLLRFVTSLFFWGIGIWFLLAGRADFLLGGDDQGQRAINVDATGFNAIAIACAFFAVGIINLAVGIRTGVRIPVFWAGVALLGATIIYGIAQVFI